MNNRYETDPEFMERFEQFTFQEVPEEEHQQMEAAGMRSMAQGDCGLLPTAHAKGNFNVRNDREFLIRTVSQCLPYIGFPRSLNCHCLYQSGGGTEGSSN